MQKGYYLFVVFVLVIGNCTADLIFVLDSSGSIGFMNWFVVKQFVIDVVKGLKVKYIFKRTSAYETINLNYSSSIDCKCEEHIKDIYCFPNTYALSQYSE